MNNEKLSEADHILASDYFKSEFSQYLKSIGIVGKTYREYGDLMYSQHWVDFMRLKWKKLQEVEASGKFIPNFYLKWWQAYGSRHPDDKRYK